MSRILLLFLTYTFFLLIKVHFHFNCIVKKILTYHMFHFTATSVTKSLKVANRVTLASLYNHNLLFCCSGIETNPLQNVCQCRSVTGVYTAQKIKFSIKAFFSKSARNCGFGHLYWRNPWWKTTFFVQC